MLWTKRLGIQIPRKDMLNNNDCINKHTWYSQIYIVLWKHYAKSTCVYHKDSFLFAGHRLWNHVSYHQMWSVPKTYCIVSHDFTGEKIIIINALVYRVSALLKGTSTDFSPCRLRYLNQQPFSCWPNILTQGSSTLFLESYNPVGFPSDPNLAQLIIIISWLRNWMRIVLTGVEDEAYRRVALQEQGWGALL